MKRNNLIPKLAIAFCAMSFAACDNMTVNTGDGSNKVVADGELTSEIREVTAFNKITMEGVFDIILIQGNRESIKVEADKNILPLILTDVQNNSLTVKIKENTSISKMKKISVYITFVDIAELNTEGVGILKSSNKLHFNDLKLGLKGVGATRLDLDASNLDIKSEIVGALILSGKATEVRINHKGIGAIQAFGLKAEKLSLQSDGIGKAEVFASQELNIDAKGMGSVEYKGDPSVKNIQNEGIGKVVSVN